MYEMVLVVFSAVLMFFVFCSIIQTMPKTRKEKRAEQRTNYLAGTARRPYTHTPTLNRSLDEHEGGD